mmetsp:Transcript_20216/g.33181  ORF Transcript_20216/g.33181 Transcript_20216/m.33181 type:complete len:96 (+) Transcript_20216:392-679(+)
MDKLERVFAIVLYGKRRKLRTSNDKLIIDEGERAASILLDAHRDEQVPSNEETTVQRREVYRQKRLFPSQKKNHINSHRLCCLANNKKILVTGNR